jgi:hypothetical protein
MVIGLGPAIPPLPPGEGGVRGREVQEEPPRGQCGPTLLGKRL